MRILVLVVYQAGREVAALSSAGATDPVVEVQRMGVGVACDKKQSIVGGWEGNGASVWSLRHNNTILFPPPPALALLLLTCCG